MRLVALHHEVRQEIVNGNLTEGHARAILALPLEKQPEAARKVIAGSVCTGTERLAGQVQKGSPQSKEKAFRDDYIIALEERLRDKCGTTVSVRMSNKGRGKIEVHFYNLEELERICEALL